ncbi:MAG: ParB N-terminal domain-containing protein [Pseudomonadota bacterium]|nr:ParB N-terminal domain-containing protein [Pseudomonadota bacterium]
MSDEQFLRERLRMVPIADLKRYEAHDETKVDKLVAKIRADRTLFNPICVVREMIVIDGANRLEALRRLQATTVPCVIYDYSELELLGNVHFTDNAVTTRLSEFSRDTGERIEFQRRSPQDIRDAVASGRLIPNGETFHRVPRSVIRLPIPLQALIADTPFDLAAQLDKRISSGQIRFYPAGVYVCDEWEDAH